MSLCRHTHTQENVRTCGAFVVCSAPRTHCTPNVPVWNSTSIPPNPHFTMATPAGLTHFTTHSHIYCSPPVPPHVCTFFFFFFSYSISRLVFMTGFYDLPLLSSQGIFGPHSKILNQLQAAAVEPWAPLLCVSHPSRWPQGLLVYVEMGLTVNRSQGDSANSRMGLSLPLPARFHLIVTW